MAPHIGEELFANTLDTLEDISIYDQDWAAILPVARQKLDRILVVQVNGKVKGKVDGNGLSDDPTDIELVNLVNASDVRLGGIIIKVIYIKDKLISVVVK
jgi:leucyl-tRNA synthetase